VVGEEQDPLAMTPAQAFELDRVATGRYGIPSIVLMENAGRAAADEAARMARDRTGAVAVVLGRGRNAGDGLVVARTLHNRGVEVRLYRAFDDVPEEGDVGANLRMVRALGLPVEPMAFDRAAAPALVVDAIFGIGLNRDAAGPALEAIEAINASGARVLAIDVPSGLDAGTGRPRGAAVRAEVTVTMGAIKTGFLAPGAASYTGRIVVAEIGYPRELLRSLSGGR
jgi:hydroxyethylthiazole kinase-like uncharacterized protein yjeF